MPEPITLEFRSPAGEALEVEWRREALAELDPAAEDAGSVWALSGELDWDEVDALRVISGRLADSRLLAIAAIRPAGAEGHGQEAVAGALDGPDGLEPLEEILISTETAPDGALRRIGLELYTGNEDIPLRLAGDVSASGRSRDGELEHHRHVADLRLDSSGEGVAVVEVLTRS